MRVLTVRQPWAWAILRAGKNVENRTRNLAGTYRGPVAIHAASRLLTIDDEQDAGARIGAISGVRPLLTLPAGLGAILGVVDLVGAHRGEIDEDGPYNIKNVCCSSPWAEPTSLVWHLELANPRPLPTPIPHRGGLGLRTLTPEQEHAVTTALAEGATHA